MTGFESSAAVFSSDPGGLAGGAVAEEPQPLRALKAANQIRTDRAQLKLTLQVPDRALAWARAADVVADPPLCARNMDIGSLLLACRGLGVRKMRFLCVTAEVAEGTAICQLSARQRGFIVTTLRKGAA